MIAPSIIEAIGAAYLFMFAVLTNARPLWFGFLLKGGAMATGALLVANAYGRFMGWLS